MFVLFWWGGEFNDLLFLINKLKYLKLGRRLGFSIGYNTLGYGVNIPHYGTIVIGGSNNIGNYAVLFTSTCITDNEKTIGDALYLSSGVVITSKVILGNGISIGANSLVNKNFEKDNIMIAGTPAKEIKIMEPWYIRDGEQFHRRVIACENLKVRMQIK